MKRIVITFIECICFFLGWAILSAVLPLSNSDNPAVWRLWAEITPLLSIIAFTFIFLLIEKKTIKLQLFNNPAKGIIIETQNPVKFKGFSFKCRNTHEINNIFLLPDATYRLLLRPVFFSKI